MKTQTAEQANGNPLEGKSRQEWMVLLRDMAKVPDLTLSHLGVEPGDQPIWVLDDGAEIQVGSEAECLARCAQGFGLTIGSPEIDALNSETAEPWSIRLYAGGVEAGVLCRAASNEEIEVKAKTYLRDLCGSAVRPLLEWSQALESAEALEIASHVPEPKKPRSKPWVVVCQEMLKPLPVAPAVLEMRDSMMAEKKVRRKEMADLLTKATGLHSADHDMKLWLRTVQDGDEKLANHNDLLSAVRLGFDVSHLVPVPSDHAHRYLLKNEIDHRMRLNGFLPVMDFDPMAVFAIDRPKVLDADASGTPFTREMKPKEIAALKPSWPPSPGTTARVVKVLDHVRLAMDIEPEWEAIHTMKRTIHEHLGRLWVWCDEETDSGRKGRKIAASKPLKSAA